METKFNMLKHLFLVLLCIPVTVVASENERSDDREQLKEILFSIEESLNTLDMDSLLSHFDEQAVVSYMTTEVSVGKEGIIAYYEKMFNLPDAPLAGYQTEVSLDGPANFHGDTMVASGRTQDAFELSDGNHYTFDTRWLATAMKKEGQWKVVALDFSVDPFDNVVLDNMSKKLVNYTLLAFLAGLVIMYIVSRQWLHNAGKRSV